MFDLPYLRTTTAIGFLVLGLKTYSAIADKKIEAPIPTTASIERIIANSQVTMHDAIRGNEAAGIEQIRSMLRSSPYEKTWLYFPKREEWLVVSKNSTLTSECKPKVGIYPDYDAIIKAFAQNDDIVLYHFHPTPQIMTKSVNAQLQEQIKEGKCALDEVVYLGNLKPYRNALPSTGDISVTLYLARSFFETQPLGIFRHKIVSDFGITQIDVTEQGKKKPQGDELIEYHQMLLNGYHKAMNAQTGEFEYDPSQFNAQFAQKNPFKQVVLSFQLFEKNRVFLGP